LKTTLTIIEPPAALAGTLMAIGRRVVARRWSEDAVCSRLH